MPQIHFSAEIKAAAKGFKINLSKIVYKMLSDLNIEDLNFILHVFEGGIDTSKTDADCGELMESGKNKTPREFRIRIKANCETAFEFLMLLGHELTHVKQFILNELVYSDCGEIAFWDGQKKVLKNYPYRIRAWERAANKAGDDFAVYFVKNRREFSIS